MRKPRKCCGSLIAGVPSAEWTCKRSGLHKQRRPHLRRRPTMMKLSPVALSSTRRAQHTPNLARPSVTHSTRVQWQAGEYERAIRLFELATTLPGAGVDYRRTSNQGMIGSATAPPNPRGMERTRFATPEQKLIAQYNIACCCAAMGDTGRTVDILRGYLEQVEQPVAQLDGMLTDADFAPVRAQVQELREEYLAKASPPGLFGLRGLKNPLREAAESIGVEWKD